MQINKVNGNVRFYQFGLTEEELAALPGEKKLLWWIILQAAADLKKGITSTTKADLLGALEALRWFMGKANRTGVKLKTSNFPSVCKYLDIDKDRIRRAIEKNDEFPTKAFLMQKLGLILAAKKLRKRNGK